MKFFRNLIRPNTASVLSTFTRTIDKLDAINTRELLKADDKSIEISNLIVAREAHIREAVVAANAATKIKKAFGL